MPMKTLKQKMLSVLFVGLAIASCTHDFSEGFRPPEMKLTVSEARTASCFHIRSMWCHL